MAIMIMMMMYMTMFDIYYQHNDEYRDEHDSNDCDRDHDDAYAYFSFAVIRISSSITIMRLFNYDMCCAVMTHIIMITSLHVCVCACVVMHLKVLLGSGLSVPNYWIGSALLYGWIYALILWASWERYEDYRRQVNMMSTVLFVNYNKYNI